MGSKRIKKKARIKRKSRIENLIKKMKEKKNVAERTLFEISDIRIRICVCVCV